jgi:hypothetical protein
MDFFNEGFLQCANCLLKGCDYRDKGAKGYCYYEITDQTQDLDSKVKVVEAMRRTISVEMRMVVRLERMLNQLKVDDEEYAVFLSELMKVNDQLNRHLNHYGHFLGWHSDTSTASMKEDRMKILKKVFSEAKPGAPAVATEVKPKEESAEDAEQYTRQEESQD